MADLPDAEHPRFAPESHWRRLVTEWAEQQCLEAQFRDSSISLDVATGRDGTLTTVQFTVSSRLLVAFLTNGRTLSPGELAKAAAVANTWNTRELVPMLSVWNVRNEQPHLAGVCNLPLAYRISQRDFDEVASSWIDQAQKMFTWCDELFGL